MRIVHMAAKVDAAGGVSALCSLGLLNFVVLQWFGIRLASVRQRVLFGDAPDATVHAYWKVLRWIWPLTGWWSDFRWIARRR